MKLSKKKSKWVKNRDTTIEGNSLVYNASLQDKYRRSIEELANQMTKETKNEIEKLFQSGVSEEFFQTQEKIIATDESISIKAKKLMNKLMAKFNKLFEDNAQRLAQKMVNGSFEYSESSLKTSLKKLSGGLTLKTSVIPENMTEMGQAMVEENVMLIKSIPSQYLGNIAGSVMRSITTGQGLKTLIPEITKYSGQSKRRIKNLALDQTSKAYNTINRQRLVSLGVTQYKWIHSYGGQFPRKDHIAMNGNIYSFDNPPIIDQRTGERGIPGQAINCRCQMNPVITFENGK